MDSVPVHTPEAKVPYALTPDEARTLAQLELVVREQRILHQRRVAYILSGLLLALYIIPTVLSFVIPRHTLSWGLVISGDLLGLVLLKVLDVRRLGLAVYFSSVIGVCYLWLQTAITNMTLLWMTNLVPLAVAVYLVIASEVVGGSIRPLRTRVLH
jgi:hypothetical protein